MHLSENRNREVRMQLAKTKNTGCNWPKTKIENQDALVQKLKPKIQDAIGRNPIPKIWDAQNPKLKWTVFKNIYNFYISNCIIFNFLVDIMNLNAYSFFFFFTIIGIFSAATIGTFYFYLQNADNPTFGR